MDDEILVRMDLRSLIDWNELGLELIKDAANGIEALERVENYFPDILVLDLGMPLMNGLQVIQNLKEMDYRGKVIVLSCHDDFDSVSEALKMGAADYLLKYVLKPENLSASLKKAMEMLEKENSQRLEIERMEKLSGISLAVLKDNFVKDLIGGTLNEKTPIEEQIGKLGISFSLGKFIVVLVEADDLYHLKEKYTKAELNRLLKSVGSVLDAVLKENSSVFGCISEGVYCILVDFERNRSFMNINSKMYAICERILSNVKTYVNLSVSIGLSRICEDPGAIEECYMQARLALDGKVYLGGNSIIHFSEVESYNRKLENFLSSYENKILKSVIEDKNEMEECIGCIFTDLKAKSVKPADIKGLCFELLMLANKMTKEYYLGYEDVFGTNYLPYHHVMNMETLDDIRKWFLSVCSNINLSYGERLRNTGNRDCRAEIRKAIEYIEENYMKEINLQEVADYANFSRTYFSQIFKQETGASFSDYLCRYRIEKAKYLLKYTDLKIYEVAAASGFENYRYFTKVFKDYNGLSPGDYKSAKP